MSKKIMVVDDDPVVVKYLVSLFQDNGYETCEATDGLKALEIVKEQKPDLITLDLEMPKEWGPRFYRRLTTDKDLADMKDTPIVVISGLPGPERAIKKAVATINKPFDPDKVMAVVKDAIGAP